MARISPEEAAALKATTAKTAKPATYVPDWKDPAPPGTALGETKYDQASATPEQTEAARIKAVDARAKVLVTDRNLTEDEARDRAEAEMDADRAMPADGGAARARGALQAQQAPILGVRGVVSRATHPRVESFTPTPPRADRDDTSRDLRMRYYSALTEGDIRGVLNDVLHPEPAEAPPDKPEPEEGWFGKIAGGLLDIAKAPTTVVMTGEADSAVRDAASGVKMVVEGIAEYPASKAARTLLDIPVVSDIGAKVISGAPMEHITKPDVTPGLAGVAERAAIRATPMASGTAAWSDILDYGIANRYSQWVRDARPSPGFDDYEDLFVAAKDDVGAANDGIGILAQMAPEDIPDRSTAGGVVPAKWKALVASNPDVVAKNPDLADLAKAMDGSDDAIEAAVRATPYAALHELDPLFGPSILEVSGLSARRQRTRKLSGSASTEALEELAKGLLARGEQTEDKRPVFVERRGAQLMRVLGTIAQGTYDADLALVDQPISGYSVKLLASIADEVGADEMGRMLRSARIPTRAGLDHALSTDDYSGVLKWFGLSGAYDAYYQEGDPDGLAGWASRVASDVTTGEMGPGYRDIYLRAGGDPTGDLASALGTFDVLLDFANPADEAVFTGVGSVARRTGRAVKAAKLAPEGMKLGVAAGAAIPEAVVKGRDIDQYAGVDQGLMNGADRAFEEGRLPEFHGPEQEVMDKVIGVMGVDPAVARARAAEAANEVAERRFDLMQKMLDRGATPAQEALRKHPEYVRVAKETDALVAAGTLTPEQARWEMLADEVRAFTLTDVGEFASPEDYFASVQREVGGTAGAGAYFSGMSPEEAKIAKDLAVYLRDDYLEHIRGDFPDGQAWMEDAIAGLAGNDPGKIRQFSAWSEPTRELIESSSLSDSDLARAVRSAITDPESFHSTIGGKQTEQGTIERVMSESTVTKGKLGADMPRLLDLLGASMYNKPLAEVATKELVQNAFDAVKGERPPGAEPAAINIRVVAPDRTISVSDNGRGMTPQIVQDALFTVGGTNKGDLAPGQRSGGLGLAKMAFLFGSDWVDVVTVRNEVRTMVHATSDQIKASNFDIVTEPAPGFPNGTTVTVKIPESFVDPKSGEVTPIRFYPQAMASKYNFLGKPMIGDVDVHFSVVPDYGKPEYTKLPSGRAYNMEATPLLTKVGFKWGSADVYMAPVRKQHPKHSVLSAGLHQFDTQITGPDYRPVPYDIVIDVHPDVEPTSASYPFNNQREGWRGTIKADVDALSKYLAQHASGIAAKETASRFEGAVSMPRVDLDAIGEIRPREVASAVGAFAAGKTAPKVAGAPIPAPVIQIEDGAVRTTPTHGRPVGPSERAAPLSFVPEKPAASAESVRGTVGVDPTKPMFHNNTSVDYVLAVRAKAPGALPEVFLSELGSVVLAFKERMAEKGGYAYKALSDPHDPYAAGISIDKGYHGVHVRVPYRAFFLNPLALTSKTPRGAAESMLHTLVHEVAHTVTMGHDATFASQLAEVYDLLGDSGDVDSFRGVLTSIMDKHWPTFEEMRRIYDDPSTRNLAGTMEDAAELPRRGEGAGAGERAGGAPVAAGGGEVSPGDGGAAERGAGGGEGHATGGGGPTARDVIAGALFQKVGPTIRGSIEPKTVGYLQRFFQTADFNTLLHEDGHLLRFLFGDRWISELAKHFEHTIDPQGLTVLTRKGEEQAAEAIRMWQRMRVQPDGRLRGMLDQINVHLGNGWVSARNLLGVGGDAATLPSEIAAHLDATFNPSGRLKRAAIELLDKEHVSPIPVVPTDADPTIAVVADLPARGGRRREAMRIDTTPAHVKAALGIAADATEIDPVELWKRAFAYTGLELYKKRGWGDEELVTLGNSRRTAVPASRARRIVGDVRQRLTIAVGAEIPLPDASGVMPLTPAQRAGVQGLINEAIHSPLGNILTKETRAFRANDPTTVLRVADWDNLNDVLIDMHAGVGARRNYLAEEVATAPLMTAVGRQVRGMLADAGTDRAAQRHADNWMSLVIHEDTAARYMNPAVREVWQETMRRFGHIGEEIAEDARAITDALNSGRNWLARKVWTKRLSAREMMSRLMSMEAPAVNPFNLDKLDELDRWFKDPLGGADKGTGPISLDALFNPKAPKLDEIETVLSSTPIRGLSVGRGMTEVEQAAVAELRRLDIARAGKPWADVLQDQGAMDMATDAIGKLMDGLDIRTRMFEEEVEDLLRCAAGSTDDSILVGAWERQIEDMVTGRKVSMPVAFYQAFWRGDWDEMFQIVSEKGHTTTGEAFNQTAAMTAMLARLRARKVMADMGDRLLALGVADVDTALALEPGTTYAREFGKNGADGYNAKKARVVRWINHLTTFNEATIARMKEVVDPVTGDVHLVKVAESRPVANTWDPAEQEARVLAERYLAQMGWQHGKGSFGDTAVMLANGTEFYLPTFWLQELAATMDRTAKVGVAFADAQRSGKVFSYNEIANAVGRRKAAIRAGLKDRGVSPAYLGLAAAPQEAGRITPLLPEEVAAQTRRRATQGAGAAIGAAAGGAVYGPLGAVAGGALGRNVLPSAIEVAGQAVKDFGPLGAPLGFVLGASLGGAKTVVDTMKLAFPFTTAKGRIGMTAGLAPIVHPAFFISNAFGAVFQTYMRTGMRGVGGVAMQLAPFFGNGVNAAHMIASMGGRWGDRLAGALPKATNLITDTGAIWTPEMRLDAARRYGLDSSYVKSESSKALYDEIRKETGAWTDKLMDRPLEALGAPLSSWQDLIMEAATSIDNANRVGVFLDNLKAGKSADEAAAIARDAAFDYGKLTDAERSVGRGVILFYSYLRQSIELFWWTAAHHPERITAILRATHGLRTQVDQPDIVLPESMDNRLILDFEQARANGHAKQGVATVSTPVPLDFIPLFFDIMGALEGSRDSAGKLASRLTPWAQYGIIKATGVDPYSGMEIDDYNSVPALWVEAMRATTGSLFDEILGLQTMENKDPYSDAIPGQERYQATNGLGWWGIQKLLQTPLTGRSIDTLTAFDRWDPLDNGGPVNMLVRGLQGYRARGGDPKTDAFVRDVLRPVAATVARPFVEDAVRTDLPMTPVKMSTAEDLAPRRPDLTKTDEGLTLIGMKAYQPNTVEVEASKAEEELRRRYQDREKEAEAAREQRYGPR